MGADLAFALGSSTQSLQEVSPISLFQQEKLQKRNVAIVVNGLSITNEGLEYVAGFFERAIEEIKKAQNCDLSIIQEKTSKNGIRATIFTDKNQKDMKIIIEKLQSLIVGLNITFL
jgi:hypothetical protein